MLLVRLLLPVYALLLGYACPGQPATLPVDAAKLAARYDAFSQFRLPRYRFDTRYAHTTLPAAFKAADLAGVRRDTRQIVRIDLVYTTYRQSQAFDQRQLNLARLKNLAALVPGILDNPNISWNLMAQTGCTSPERCQEMLHGFVLYTAKRYTKADVRGELTRIEAGLRTMERKLAGKRGKADTLRRVVRCAYPELIRYPQAELRKRFRQAFSCKEKFAEPIAFRIQLDASGRIDDIALPAYHGACQPHLRWALRQTLSWRRGFVVGTRALPCEATGFLDLAARTDGVRIASYTLADSLVQRYAVKLKQTRCFATSKPLPQPKPPPPDSGTVYRVLARNPTWRKELIVVDVTGSMYTYTLDLLTWLRPATRGAPKTFVFFNDGDDRPDEEKQIGDTGGLHAVRTADFEKVKETLAIAMLSGGGGDLPENNFEALRYGLQQAPNAPEAIMVADNYAFPRDARLLKQLAGVNLKLILCGTTPAINPQYLNLARQYHFSIHTLEADLTNLAELRVGEELTANGVRYMVTKTGFRIAGGFN